MWKKLIIGVVGIMASSAVQETEAFSSSTTNIHPTSQKSSRINTQSTTALSESFYNYGKDAPDGEYNNVNGGAAEQPTTQKSKGFFANFFEELDAFVDDATSRRLGNGAQYYGKRKSSFYGENDVNKKRDRNIADTTEDYRGPSNAGYFKWLPDPETGELKPVTRLREVNIEKKR